MKVNISRRELLAGAGVGAAALLLDQRGVQAQAPPSKTVVFSHTTVVNADTVQDDVALAIAGDTIASIGPTDEVLKKFPGAEVYDGRGKALFPGLINCHAHLAATLARGFNEDFGFPNSARLAIQPASLLQGEEATLMVTVGALEAIRTGTTTIVENTGNISRSAAALADTGLRCVFAESIRDSENVAGPMSPEGLAKSVAPRFSPKLRDEGLQRINDLFTKWHGARQGRISVFPAAALAETASPELLQAVRAFADKHDLGYTIHLSQSRAEVDFMVRHHGLRPPAFLHKHGFLGPRLFAAHCRYVDDGDIALLGGSGTIVTHQAAMAANRGVIPPIAKLRAAGCPIANGTDNNTNDLFEVMRIALLTERISRNDAFPGHAPTARGHARRRNPRGRASRASGKAPRLARGRKEGRSPRRGYATGPPRARGAHRVRVDPQWSTSRHRIRDGRRSVHHAQWQGADDGREQHRRRSRQGWAPDLEAGAGGRSDNGTGPTASALTSRL